MSNIRVMFIGSAQSGLARDSIVNTFHFVGAGTYAADAPVALNKIQQFYVSPAPSADPVGAFVSPWIKRPAELRSYDLDTDKPRVPTSQFFTLPTGTTSGIPEEVAVCLSFAGAVPPAVTARRRGRIYLGPLSTGAADFASSTHMARPSDQVIAALAFAAARMATDDTGGVDWSILSTRPTQNFVKVVGGWVDNAFDTQRRRGPDATQRNPWVAALP